MTSTQRHNEFAPPPTPGMLRALILAILAHGVLLVALTAGVQWKRAAVQQTVEAELWSAIPVQAAPPAPEPVPEPEPPKPVPPEIKPEPKPDPGPTPAEIKAQADIAIAKQKEKEKAKLLKEKQLALEKAELEKKKQAEQDKQKQAKLEQDKKDKLAKAKDDQQRKQDQQAEAAATKARAEQMKRMANLAGSGGGNTPGGANAAQSSGPSAGYAGRIVARIKPYITYPDNIDGNPRVEVEIRTSPSGNILSARITQSSGVKSWDEAITRAIEKTQVLPMDVDGTVPKSLLIGFRPKD